MGPKRAMKDEAAERQTRARAPKALGFRLKDLGYSLGVWGTHRGTEAEEGLCIGWTGGETQTAEGRL